MIQQLIQQLGLYCRHHIHLVSALLFSASLHYGLVHAWPQPSQENRAQKNSLLATQHSLRVVLMQPASKANTEKIVVATQEKNALIDSEKKLEKPAINALTQTKKVAQSNGYTAYLSPQEVEMQALPIVNIDLSMLPQAVDTGDLQQKMPIQLRLYINEFGQVVRVERISMVLAQDNAMANALEETLKKMQFTPAKRAFTSVKSYQEVAFDFKKTTE